MYCVGLNGKGIQRGGLYVCIDFPGASVVENLSAMQKMLEA